jgi:hypothetical protein
MIKHCLIHFGFPKTGTTSIQRFLRHKLSDPGFYYPAFNTSGGLSDDCHNRALNCAFRSDPEKFHAHAKAGLSKEIIRQQGHAFCEQLQHAVRNASAHTLLLSAEDLSWFPADDIRALIDFVTGLGLPTQALAFVRRSKRDQESRFQQSLRDPGFLEITKQRRNEFLSRFLTTHYKHPISNFDNGLGRSNVLLFEFDPSRFEGGCAVRQFCKLVGIRQQTIPATFVNDSLSSEALKLLCAYRTHGPGYGEGWGAMEENRRLVEKLSELKGPRLVFHSSLLNSKEDKWRADVEWAMERTGFDLLGNIYEDDDKPCVRGAEDMFRFSPESLDWLARAANVEPSRLASADPTVVAATVHTLRKQLARPSLRGRLRNFVKGWF